jgi:hypothetical protein
MRRHGISATFALDRHFEEQGFELIHGAGRDARHSLDGVGRGLAAPGRSIAMLVPKAPMPLMKYSKTAIML